MNNILSVTPEPLFAENLIEFCGQPIGIVVAKTEAEAQAAANNVNIKYTNIKKPIITIDEAIEAKSFNFHPLVSDHTKGDAEEAIKNSKNQISGEFRVDSSQYNFFLEVS